MYLKMTKTYNYTFSKCDMSIDGNAFLIVGVDIILSVILICNTLQLTDIAQPQYQLFNAYY